MAIKIAIMSYKELSGVIRQMNYRPPDGIEICIVEKLLGDALTAAKAMEAKGEVDIFLSAGANLATIAPHLKTPLVGISVTGFDLLLALAKVKTRGPVGIVSYQQKLLYVDRVLNVLAVELLQTTFDDVQHVDVVLDRLVERGIRTVLGGSLVVEKARQRGMQAVFMYSEDGVQRALDTAVKVGVTKQKEAEKAEELHTIINFAHEGIIATDRNGAVTVFNPSAEKITRITRQSVIGRPAKDCIPGTHLHDILRAGEPELNQIQVFGQTKVLTNRVPIVTQGEVTGAVATFQDVDIVREAETKIRIRLSERGFLAKHTFADIVHAGPLMADTIKEARQYARTDSAIVILGESGTGKEIFAQAIHNESGRRKKPFVAINCAALPANLLESELFGYEEGAFTGAKKGGKAGVFELSHGGTIFLDEIGEVPKAIQSRLLRVLQEHEVLRIGGERIVPVDLRVVAATNKNLWDMVKQGRFRQDLYYRLCVLELHIPPLRRRYEDVPALVARFLRQYRSDLPQPLIETVAANPALRRCPWSGNVRELRNIVERFAVRYNDRADIGRLVHQILGEREERLGDDSELDRIRQALSEADGNKTKAARTLGISRTTLWRKLQEAVASAV